MFSVHIGGSGGAGGMGEFSAERLLNGSLKPPYQIHSRDGKRWHDVDAVTSDAFGDVMFMHKTAVVRRVNPVTRVRVRK